MLHLPLFKRFVEVIKSTNTNNTVNMAIAGTDLVHTLTHETPSVPKDGPSVAAFSPEGKPIVGLVRLAPVILRRRLSSHSQDTAQLSNTNQDLFEDVDIDYDNESVTLAYLCEAGKYWSWDQVVWK